MMGKINNFSLKAGLTALLLSMGASLNATSYASVKAMGLGGACVAHGQDAITGYFNPATATQVGDRADIGLYAQFPRRSVSIGPRTFIVTAPPPGEQSGTIQTNNTVDFYGDGGINTVFGCCNEFAVGLQWNNYNHIHNHFSDLLSDLGTSYSKFNYRTEVLSVNFAYQIDCRNSIGIGLNTYFSWFDVTGLEGLAAQSADATRLTNKGTEYASGFGVTVGWVGKFLCDQLSLGVAYSPSVDIGEFENYTGLLARRGIDIPTTFRFGAAYDLDACTLLVADAEFRRYSHVRALSNPYTSTAIFGTREGPGFNWTDQWIVKLGVEHALPCFDLTLRLGYRYEQSPIPRNGGQDTYLNILTLNSTEHFITGGLTYTIDCIPELCFYNESEVSVFGEYGFSGRIRSGMPALGLSEPTDLRFKSETASVGIAYGVKF